MYNSSKLNRRFVRVTRSRICAILFVLKLFCENASAQVSCPNLIDRPYRGLSCLHCLHPNAPDGAAPLVEVLASSCLKRVALAFVVDGSFGWNPEEIYSAIDTLSSSGRSLWLHLYVYNGPAQRRWRSGVFSSFAMMDPNLFRGKIVNDATLRAKFAAIVQDRITPLVRYAVAHGAAVSIAPALEDNLDDRGFKEALGLVKANLQGVSISRFIRSPCYRCAGGASSNLPAGVTLEQHTLSPRFIARNGIVHTDGEYFHFSTDPAWSKTDPILDGLRTLLVNSGLRGNVFLLWIPKYQDAPPGLLPRSPDTRNYRAPTVSERTELIRFLTY